ncbi:MAG: FecR domain-containing protein [Bacteroidota bacterium]
MNRNNFISLLFKKFKGEISLEEQSMLDVWVSQDAANEAEALQMEKDWQLSKRYQPKEAVSVDIESDFQQLMQRIRTEESLAVATKDNLRVAHKPVGKMVAMSSKKSNRRWLAWASAAVIALAIGFWFSSGVNGVAVEELAVETAFQEERDVTLADGTTVRLNQNSQLRYPAAFDGDSRTVELIGEAFFDVTKNPQQPFIIKTAKAKVTVLGTSFNVRAKAAEQETTVIVKSGKVRLENTTGGQKVDLTANQKGIFNKSTNQVIRASTLNQNDLAWYSDRIIFDGIPIEEAIADLSKQFDVKITVTNTALTNCRVSGRFRTDDGIEQILKAIADSFAMKLKIVGNTTFELKGGSC